MRQVKLWFAVLPMAAVMLAAGLGFWLAGKAKAAGAEPGSAADPLVSQSYVDQFVKTYVNQQIQGAVALLGSTAAEVASSTAQGAVDTWVRWQVVNMQPGQMLTAGPGTEFVLRAGRATVIAQAAGGLADLTAGEDLGDGRPVPANHLLLAARADGRGLTAKSAAVLLVRGPFDLD